MVCYTCERCGYQTYHKSVFRKHLNRKRVCLPIIIDIPIEVLRDKFESTMSSKRKKKKPEPQSNVLPSIPSEPIDDLRIEDVLDDTDYIVKEPSEDGTIGDLDERDSIYLCSYCDAQFTRKYNCTRHQNKCRRRVEGDKEDKISELQDKIDKLGKLLESKTVGSGANIIGNNNTVIDKQQNNIIINNYKSENTEYITNRVLQKILTMGPVLAVPRLMKYLHFNKKHPENHNLAITNIHSKFAHVRNNNMWQVRLLNELLEELVSSKFNILDEYFEMVGRDKIPKLKANSYEKYREKIYEDDDVRDQLKNKLYETIVNFSKELDIVKNI